MNEYKKLVQQNAQDFWSSIAKDFQASKDEHGGAGQNPNLGQWLDNNQLLLRHLQSLAESWTRADAEFIRTHSRNSENFGTPKEVAIFAHYKDVLFELKRLAKK